MANYREENAGRSQDEKRSKAVSRFLDETFYKEKTTDFERVEDTDRQVRGLDVIFTMDGKEYKADEKAAVNWENIQTFSLELTFINRNNEIQEGWFLSDTQENNSYVFVWIDSNDLVDYKSLTLAVVKKKKLKEYVDSLGWTKEKLLRKAKLVRENKNENLGSIKYRGCEFRLSDKRKDGNGKMSEKPVNIMLSRYKYLELADTIWSSKLPKEIFG